MTQKWKVGNTDCYLRAVASLTARHSLSLHWPRRLVTLHAPLTKPTPLMASHEHSSSQNHQHLLSVVFKRHRHQNHQYHRSFSPRFIVSVI